MNKGQKSEQKLKNILKVFKMNEDKFSTILGVIVVFLVGMMILNYFKSAKLNIWKGSIFDNAASTTAETEKTEESKEKLDTYIVVKGDDLWHISERYYKSGYNYVDIIKENSLPANGKIEPGMELRIPKVEPKKQTLVETKIAETKKKEIEQPKAQTERIDLDTYTTQKGDSLWDISVRAYGDGFKWTKIYWENRELIGKNPNMLYSGVKLNLPKI